MNVNFKTMAMIEVAEHILKQTPEPKNIKDLMKEVLSLKEMSLDDIDSLTQLYLDITLSAKFVYMGEELWDLKERNIEYWDKDGYAFIEESDIEEDIEDEEELDFTEFALDEEELVVETDEDEEETKIVDEDEKEEAHYIASDLPITSIDDDSDDELDIEFDDDYNEDDYNEIMDDYEDMYDE